MKNLKQKHQEYFDEVWNHFVVEEAPNSTDGEYYRYRGPNGEKCAIGLLIPDELYDPKMELTTIEELLNDNPTIQKLFDANSLTFLQLLQGAHDSSNEATNRTFHEQIKNRLTMVAYANALTIPK